MRPLFYRRDGKPYEGDQDEQTLAWAKDFSNFEIKRVADTILENKKRVSTVWIGVDSSFLSEGPPMIFESMVFSNDGSWSDIDMEQYSTETDALAGHKKLVEKWSAEA